LGKARAATVENHVHRSARMGSWMTINAGWYKSLILWRTGAGESGHRFTLKISRWRALNA